MHSKKRKIQLCLYINLHINIKFITKGGIIISILQDLYYNNVDLQGIQSEMSPKLKKQLNELVNAEEKLSETLSDDQKKLLQKYSEMNNEFCSLSCENTFIVAVKFAMRFAHEVFAD